MVIKFNESQDLLNNILKYLSEAETKNKDIDIAEFRGWLLDSHEAMMDHAHSRTDYRKVQNDSLISNLEKNVTPEQVKEKVITALSKVSKNQLPPNVVTAVKKLPRNKGKQADLFKVTLSSDKIEDKNGHWNYPQQRLIAGISAFNQVNKTEKLFASAFIPTCAKEQGNRLNDLASRIRAKNKTQKWFTRLIVSQKEMRLVLKVKSPNKDATWCEVDASSLPNAFKEEYKEILSLPLTPYKPKPKPNSDGSQSTPPPQAGINATQTAPPAAPASQTGAGELPQRSRYN